MQIKIGQVGIAAFLLGIVIVTLMIWSGVSGHRWPQWLLVVTAIL